MFSGVVLAAAFALAGCANRGGYNYGQNPPTGAPLQSFYTNPNSLEPVANSPGVSRYVSNTFPQDMQRFRGIYIAPIEVWLSPSSPYKGMTSQDIEGLTQTFRKVFAGNALLPLVDQPAPDVLVVRIALTNVYLQKVGFRPRDILPIGLAIDAVHAAQGQFAYYVENMTIEAEGDEPDGRVVFAIKDQTLNPSTLPEKQPSMKDVALYLEDRAIHFRNSMQAMFPSLRVR
jgi:hypothetical protein